MELQASMVSLFAALATKLETEFVLGDLRKIKRLNPE